MAIIQTTPSIELGKEDLYAILRPRVRESLPGAVQLCAHAVSPEAMPVADTASWLQMAGICLNKTEVENVTYHFGCAGGTVNVAAFLDFLSDPATVPGTSFAVGETLSPHKSHLALSGVSHTEFGTQYKEFPAAWGQPPNASVKGHDGVVRELPNGYGKGNGPLYKWVVMNLDKDAASKVDADGLKPYLYGGYSFGCTKPKGGYPFSMSNP